MKPILFLLLIAAVAGVALAQGVNHRTGQSMNLDVSTKRKIVDKALALKPGDSFKTVTNALGKPTTDTNYGGDYHYLDYHMQAWLRWTGVFGSNYVSDVSSSDSEYVRVRLNQCNQVVSVWIQVDTR
jgi:outer membrane protein assembly factor BamE (lipoprotein component of BamABCDE complex)